MFLRSLVNREHVVIEAVNSESGNKGKLSFEMANGSGVVFSLHYRSEKYSHHRTLFFSCGLVLNTQ